MHTLDSTHSTSNTRSSTKYNKYSIPTRPCDKIHLLFTQINLLLHRKLRLPTLPTLPPSLTA